MQNHRNYALDLMRGLTIALMIIVNNPGDWKEMFSVLRHADWHGFLGADIVFPFFLFVSGFAAALTLSAKPVESRIFYFRLLRRTVILFLLGLFLNAWPFGILPGTEFSLSHLRIFGVLQRIAICVLIGGIILRHITSTQGMIIVLLGLTTIYEVGMRILVVNAVDGVFGQSFELKDNFARFVDTNILPTAMLYKVQKIPFDPEGLFTSLTAVMTFLIGGVTYRITDRRMLMTMTFLVLGSLILIFEPINKNLWTLPYVFLTAGTAIAFLTILEKTNFKESQMLLRISIPFTEIGRGPLLIYVLSGIIGKGLALWKLPAGTSLKQYLFSLFLVLPVPPQILSLMYSLILLFVLVILIKVLQKVYFYARKSYI